MKFKKMLLAAMTAIMAISANAQEAQDKVEYNYNSHWFLQLQAGAQHTLGEAKFFDLVSPNAQIALGYQFNPVWAVRLGVNAWQSKAGWKDGSAEGFGLPHKNFSFNYFAPAIDVKFNIINAFAGWNPDRVFTMNLIAGGGVNVASGLGDDAEADYNAKPLVLSHYYDGTKVRPVGRFGLDFDFQVSKRVSLNLECMANILSDHYNGKHADNADWYFNALAGVKIALGDTYTKTVIPAPEPEPAPAPVVVEKPAPKPVVEEKIEPYRCDIFFKINKFIPDDSELAKLDGLSEYLNKYPNAKVEICGYADKGTGTAKYNAMIAEKRANKIASILEEKYNVPSSRISINSKGDTVQPFAENDQNRVTICIAE